MTLAATLTRGFLPGMRHAAKADHIAAVPTLATLIRLSLEALQRRAFGDRLNRNPRPRRDTRYGAPGGGDPRAAAVVVAPPRARPQAALGPSIARRR